MSPRSRVLRRARNCTRFKPGSAVCAACIAVQNEAARRAVSDQHSQVFGAALESVEWRDGRLRRRGDSSPGQAYADIVDSGGGAPIEASASSARDPAAVRKFSMHAFGAVFVEVAIDPDVGTISRLKSLRDLNGRPDLDSLGGRSARGALPPVLRDVLAIATRHQVCDQPGPSGLVRGA